MFDTALSTIATCLLLVLAFYLMVKKRNLSDTALAAFLVLLALIEASDQYLLKLQYYPSYLIEAPVLLVSLLPLVCILFSLVYGRRNSVKSLSAIWLLLVVSSLAFPASVFLFPVEDFFYSPDLKTDKMLFLGDVGYWFYLGVMFYCVMALMNLEATFSSTKGVDRWRMKFEVLGVISALAFLIFFFSQGLLYRTINLNLAPLRSGVLIISTLMVGYSKLIRGNGVRVVMSRYILYRSLTLLLVGLYLLMLGLMGEGMKYFKISFGRDLLIFIAFVAGIAMLAVLFSEKLRRKARVFINKHFYAQKHDYREEWLKFTGRLASCKTVAEVLSAILSTYRETFGFSGAALYFAEGQGNGYSCAAKQEMSGRPHSFEASPGMTSYFTDRRRVLNPLDGEYKLTPGEAAFVQKAGADLIIPLNSNGRLEGFVVLGRQIAEDEFIYEDYDLMKTFAEQATLAIKNFKLSEELVETRELTAMARISSFVIHDLKNLASTLSLLLENAEDYIQEPAFQSDMISSVRGTVMKMKALMERLRTFPEKRQLSISPEDLHLLAREAVAEFMKASPGTEITCHGVHVVSMADREELRKVILNLVLNAIEAIGGQGKVEVETGLQRGMAYVAVRDNGCGISEEFVLTSLFKPFRTTKKKGLGVGLYQCKQVVEAHGGSIEAQSEVGKGTVFTVYLPVAAEGTKVAH